uniref:Uncharacterized protein n=1 Tax=Anguilla anguilla TaxID=7936 RepID=A0A0E9UB30_ANGAN
MLLSVYFSHLLPSMIQANSRLSAPKQCD